MKGRVRRCTIEGTVPEIKTKNYISYLETFLIWFCEKEQHKEGERRAVHGGRADSLQTVHGGRADSSQTTRGQCKRHANGMRRVRKTRGQLADSAQRTTGQLADGVRKVRTTCGRHANSADGGQTRSEWQPDDERTTSGRRAEGERMACEQCANDCFEKETMLLNVGENGDEKEKKKRGKEKK